MKKTSIMAGVESGILKIRITGQIGEGEQNRFRNLIDDALQKGIKTADLYLNTPGGDVFEASEMVNELKRMDAVTVTVGALAASSGTYILAHFPTRAYGSSQFMIHKPWSRITGNENEIKAHLKALENLTVLFKKAYAKRLNKSEEHIESLWQNDRWMTAQEALEIGLITEIINETLETDQQTIAMMQGCGAPKIPKIESTTKNKNPMDRIKVITSLGLAADATDDQIYKAIAEAKEKATVSDALKTQLEASQNQRIENLVMGAIADKRISTDQKHLYTELATANYRATELILQGLPKPTPLSGQLNAQGFTGALCEDTYLTYEDYIEKAPEKFDALLVSEPKKAMELFNKRRT